MTVIVYRDGIMAADSGAWLDTVLVTTAKKKIIRLPDGGLAGFAGSSEKIDQMRRWLLEGGERPEKEQDFQGIIVRSSGVFRVWDTLIEHPAEDAPFWAAGAERTFLYGALFAGASAPAAVQLAIDYCDGAAGKMEWQRYAGPDA